MNFSCGAACWRSAAVRHSGRGGAGRAMWQGAIEAVCGAAWRQRGKAVQEWRHCSSAGRRQGGMAAAAVQGGT